MVVLAVILVLATALGVGAYYYMNQPDEIITTEMSAPSLPQISFTQDGYEINTLVAYTSEMDITTMRDVITPLNPQGKLDMILYSDGEQVETLNYEILSMSGDKTIISKKLTSVSEGSLSLDLSNAVPSTEEVMLKLKLTLSSGEEVYFYTRVCTYSQYNLSEKLSYIEAFHLGSFEMDAETFAETFGTSEAASISSLQTVTLTSSSSAITWGDLEVTLKGDIQWNIKECTSVFTMVQLEYQVEAPSETDSSIMDTYNVKEFFRVTYSTTDETVTVSQYQRTMNQVLDEDSIQVSEDGILLGIVDSDIDFEINEDNTVVAFVQERALWSYNYNLDTITCVFSFGYTSDNDIRSWYDMHDIRILSISEEGNIIFTVYGYMNAGDHEGKVGAAVYVYYAAENTLEEKFFVDYDKGFAVAEETLSEWVYYSNTENVAYIIALDAFYKVNLEDGSQVKLVDTMLSNQYVISDDGNTIAYQSGSETIANAITVLNFESGESYEISSSDGANVIPIGFLYTDFVYGYALDSDIGIDEFDMTIEPMYALEIRDDEGTVMKSYEKTGFLINEAIISSNQIDIILVEEIDGIYEYGELDLVTNNVTQASSKVSISQYSTTIKLAQQMLELSSSIDVENIIINSAVLAEKIDALNISYDISQDSSGYYVYAYGELFGSFEQESDAIVCASANYGAVVNGEQEYVWRSGSRDLTYYSSSKSDWVSRLQGGEDVLSILTSYAVDNIMNYTGCTTEQMCYLINTGHIIAAKKNDEWILLFGYTGSTMYYLDEAGDTYFMTMTTLDNQIQYMIGDGYF